MQLLKNYSLSITLFFFFLFSWLAQGYFQYQHEYQQSLQHGQELTTSEFTESYLAATFENWQSEFLQLFTMVVLTSFLIHKGSPESKDSDEKMEKLLQSINRKLGDREEEKEDRKAKKK
jgi:hypothetical protein